MGYEDGYQDGKEKITTELENLVYNVNNFAKCQFDMKNRIIKSIHTDILDMVLDISEKICLTELRQNKEILTKIVANTISQLKEKESVTIIVNPEMARKIYEISNDLKDAIHNLEHIKIVEDATIAPDGTIVESVGSRVDARVSAQIEQIAQKLFAELNKTPEIELARELDDVEAQLNNDKPEQI
jgi:flagellar biosynthesis/type III secretory pathway protein FliH